MKDWLKVMQPERAAEEAREKMRYTPMGKLWSGVMENKTFLHGPLSAYVVNFSTKDPHPHKFLYPVCTKLLENGTVCKKSLQFGEQCDHDSFAEGDFTYIYRFEVLLSDAKHDGHSLPLWCKISQAASLLIEVPAKVFREWTEQAQYRHVRDIILKVPLCEVYLQVEGRKATIQIIQSSFATLNRPLSPYLSETSSKDKGKGKIQENAEEQDEVSDGERSSTDKGEGELQEFVEDQDELRDGETPCADQGEGNIPEIVEEQDDLRDGQTSYKDKGKGKVQEIEEEPDECLLDGSHVNQIFQEMDYAPDRPSSSTHVYHAPHRRWSPNHCRPFGPSSSSDDEVQTFAAYQEPEIIWSSPDHQVKPAVKLSQLVKKGWKYLIAALKKRV